RNGEYPHQHGHEVEPLPEIQRVQREARHSRLRILPDHREEQTQPAGEEAAHHAARALRAERGDEGETDDRQHEELGRTEGQHQRAHDRDGERECRTSSRPWTKASSTPARYSPNFMYLLNSSTMSLGCDRTSFKIFTACSPEV